MSISLPLINFLYSNYTILAIIIAFVLGSSLWFFITFTTFIYAAPPPRQFSYTLEYLKGIEDDEKRKQKEKKEQKESSKQQRKSEYEQNKEDRLILWVSNSYKRLGLLKTYEDFLTEIKTYQFLFIVAAVVFCAMFTIMSGIFFIILLVLPAIIFSKQLASVLVTSSLRGQITKLNYRQKIELPLLISRFIAIATKVNDNAMITVIQGYLPHAGWLKEDLTLVVSDMINIGQTEALNNWSARISIGDTSSNTLELITFIEKIKKLYSKGDEIYCKSELSALARTIDDKYMTPFRDKQVDMKFIIMQVIVVANFASVGFFFAVPLIISIMEGMNSIG